MFLVNLSHASLAFISGGGYVDTMVNGICQMVQPLVGSNSKMLSLIFLISLGVIAVMWFLNENKEGLMVWVLRAGLALGILINIFTLPQLFGLPAVCGG
jgi:hypothetical protein